VFSAFIDMEINGLTLMEDDMSISGIQTRSPARRGLTMDPEKSRREHYTGRLLRYETCASVITMAMNGEPIRSSAKLLYLKHG
jgi:transposase-like protein